MQARSHSDRFDRRAGLFFAAAALALTWPLAFSPGEAISVRDDYYQNLWNAWWLGRSLFELHVSPWWTDFLFYPTGIDLARHTLSPLNALAMALLSGVVSPDAAFSAVLWLHFWLSGWAAFELARDQTGSPSGAAIAGLLYAYCPIHYFYMPQINIATFEFLPLVILFLHRTWREGGSRNAVGAVVCVALQAASGSYFLMYSALVALGLLAFGRHFGPPAAAPDRRRLLLAGAAAGVAMAAICWPLLSNVVGGWMEGAEGVANLVMRPAGNDLLGFNWMIEANPIVSWPTLLGYSSLLLVATGFRGLREQKGWIAVGAVFWVLSLGVTLRVAGTDTQIPLPYAVLAETPVLGLLRMSNRFFVVSQLAFAVLCAAAWKDLARRWLQPRQRPAVAAACAAAITLELTCVPLQMFQTRCAEYLHRIADASDVASLVELPTHHAPSAFDARYNYCQLVHQKKIPQGYVTALAVDETLSRESQAWSRASRRLDREQDARPVARLVEKAGIDRVVLNKAFPRKRKTERERGEIFWKPFFLMRHLLIGERQQGYVEFVTREPTFVGATVRALRAVFGPPLHEDDEVVVFDGDGAP